MKARTRPVFSFRFNPPSKRPIIASIAVPRPIANSLAARADRNAKTLVSAIIPARNEEASIARAVESVAAQPEVGEVIVVNDQSTDRTGAILAELAARIPKLKVLAAGELPAGWVGKNHAVSVGAAAATRRLAALHRCGHVPLAGRGTPGACAMRWTTMRCSSRIRPSRKWKHCGSAR